MCDPATIALVAGATKAVGSLRQGAQADAAGRFNQQAAYAEAQDAQARGSFEETRYRREVAQLAGRQQAEFGARNVEASSGSPLAMMSDTAQFGEEDALTIRRNAGRQAYTMRLQGDEARRQGRAAKKASYFDAAGNLLTAGAQANGMWRS